MRHVTVTERKYAESGARLQHFVAICGRQTNPYHMLTHARADTHLTCISLIAHRSQAINNPHLPTPVLVHIHPCPTCSTSLPSASGRSSAAAPPAAALAAAALTPLVAARLVVPLLVAAPPLLVVAAPLVVPPEDVPPAAAVAACPPVKRRSKASREAVPGGESGARGIARRGMTGR